jgi:hypothetical protein
MASIIKPKRTTVPGTAPTSETLQNGEMCVNLADGKLFFRNGDSIVVFDSHAENYGVNESVVGYFTNTDGTKKPIYKKSITLPGQAIGYSAGQTRPLAGGFAPDIEYLIDFRAFYDDNTEFRQTYADGRYFTIEKDTGNLNFYTGSVGVTTTSSNKIFVTVVYTKTTDAFQ